jgi:hypothetical protein
VRGQRERVDASVGLPCRETRPKVRFDARRSLVAILSRFREKLQHDLLDWCRDAADAFARRRRFAGDVAMDPFHRIRRREWKGACKHLVQRDA